jgi:hypothetical protein
MAQFRSYTIGAVFAAAAGLSFGSANAGIIWTNTFDATGSGLGSVTTALTIHDNDGDQEGCVGWDGSTSAFGAAYCDTANTSISGGNEGGGSVQGEAWSLADLGNPASADLLRILFNAAEPGGNAITLDDMFLTFWSDAGVLLYTTGGLGAPAVLDPTQQGIGVSGEVFRIDDLEAAIITGMSFWSDPTTRVGLVARTSDSQNGPETFYLGAVAGEVPEPAMIGLFGLGLLGLGAARRRRLI